MVKFSRNQRSTNGTVTQMSSFHRENSKNFFWACANEEPPLQQMNSKEPIIRQANSEEPADKTKKPLRLMPRSGETTTQVLMSHTYFYIMDFFVSYTTNLAIHPNLLVSLFTAHRFNLTTWRVPSHIPSSQVPADFWQHHTVFTKTTNQSQLEPFWSYE